MSFSRVTEEGFKDLAAKTLVLAEYEGFPAHAAALIHRLERGIEAAKRNCGRPFL